MDDGRSPRFWTCKVLDACDEGVLDPSEIIAMCLSYMSEWEVEDMLRLNDLKEYLNPSEEDSDE